MVGSREALGRAQREVRRQRILTLRLVAKGQREV